MAKSSIRNAIPIAAVILLAIFSSCRSGHSEATAIPDEADWRNGFTDYSVYTQFGKLRELSIRDGNATVIVRLKERTPGVFIDAEEIEVVDGSNRFKLPAEISTRLGRLAEISNLVKSGNQLKFIIHRGDGEFSYATVIRISMNTLEIRVDDWHAVTNRPVRTHLGRLQPR